MTTQTQTPVLMIGGSGTVGSQAARFLRMMHPELPLAVGGRDLGKAQAIAAEVGNAEAVRIDLERPDLGLADGGYGAVVMFLKDDGLNSLAFAQRHEAAYLSISSAAFEIGPEVARYIHSPASAPVLMMSNWLAGTATLAALHFARDFDEIESIAIAALLDDEDIGGPAAHVDYVRQTQAAPRPLLLKHGKWVWADAVEAGRNFSSVDGTEFQGQALANLDLLSLAASTGATSVRFDFAVGQTASRRRGAPFSHEIVIEMTGRRADRRNVQERYEIVHPHGQAPMTAVGVAVGVERLLGLVGGAPVPPGLYLPDVLIEPAYMVERLEEFGARLRRSGTRGS